MKNYYANIKTKQKKIKLKKSYIKNVNYFKLYVQYFTKIK